MKFFSVGIRPGEPHRLRNAVLSRLWSVVITAAGLSFAGAIGLISGKSKSNPSEPQAGLETPKLDSYGGVLPTVDGPSGSFHLKKLGDRWIFVTPEGGAFWMLGVFNVVVNSSTLEDGKTSRNYVLAKYGDDNTTWGNQTIRRLKSWSFNTLAEYETRWVDPFDRRKDAPRMPVVGLTKISQYGRTNQWNLAPGPFKDLIDCQDGSVYTGWAGDGTPDVFDPNFDIYTDKLLASQTKDSYYSSFLSSPWVIGGAMDDTDYIIGFGPGDEVPAPDGAIHPHIGWLALAANPSKSSSEKWRTKYPDDKVYGKFAIRDYLYKKYGGSIAALNRAWNANYTTFDSAGGWGRGTGLLDENGRHTNWLGPTAGDLKNIKTQVRIDLDEFLYEYAKKYFSVTSSRYKQYSKGKLFFGPATLNGHGGLTRTPIFRAAAQYCDVIQVGISSQDILDRVMRAVGDKPLVLWIGWGANPDSEMFPYPNQFGFVNTQIDRAEKYRRTLLGDLGFDAKSQGVKPIAGVKWWEWSDNWGEKANWGLVTFRDNAYDGKEAVVTAGKDQWGYPTGGERRNYGDFLSGVHGANEELVRKLRDEVLSAHSGTNNSSDHP